MKPVQHNLYLERESSDQFRFLGYAEMLHDGEEPTQVCVMSPCISGFEMAQQPEPEHTRFIICDVEDFSSLFDEASQGGDRFLGNGSAPQEK